MSLIRYYCVAPWFVEWISLSVPAKRGAQGIINYANSVARELVNVYVF